jgi:Fur family ferric uptake transcriptional regulator
MAKKHHSHRSLTSALDSLKASGLKRTKPREVVLQYLVDHHGPFSAKDIHIALKRKELDAVTIYRCLSAFEEAGLARRCDFGDGIARYEISNESDHHHHHVICTDCRRIETLDDCNLPKQLEAKVEDLGYSQVRHVLEFMGLCGACSKKSA